MRGLVACCLGLCLVACGDDAGTMCAPGTHLDGDACVEDTMCLPTTCGDHGTCSVVGDELDCACEEGYTGTNCGGCAAGFQDHGNTGVCSPACAMQCGRFGQCDDSSGTVMCTCNGGTIGDTCNTCDTTTAMILDDTFGAAGTHNTLDITPGITIVAPLPSLGGAASGTLAFNMIAGMPNRGSQKFVLAFSRCPADLTYADSQRVMGMKPCMLETTSVNGGSIRWIETGFQSSTECLLPPGDGPWYANLKVDYSLTIEMCDDAGPCKIDWQWN